MTVAVLSAIALGAILSGIGWLNLLSSTSHSMAAIMLVVVLSSLARIVLWAAALRTRVAALHVMLAEHTELQRSIWDNASEAIIVTDDSGSIAYVSPNAKCISGYEPSEVRALGNIDALLGPAPRRLLTHLPDGAVGDFDCHTVDRHGRPRTLAARVRRWSLHGGTRLFVLRDETTRKQVEADLERERSLYEHIVSDSPLLIVALQPDGATNFVNAAVTHVTGYRPDELIGRNWWRIFYPGADYAQVEQLLADETNFRVRDYEMTLTTKDGRKRVIAWNTANILDARKRATTIVGIGRDVTDRNQLEDDLRQAHKMEAIGRLASGIAHDFNNLLTIILGNRDLLEDTLHEVGPAVEPLQELGDAAKRAAALTQQLLEFSRRQPFSPQIANLNDLVRGLAALLNRLIGDDIQVITQLESEMAWVKVDPAQFEQILLNLAINARDAMPHGGRLTITTSNVSFSDTLTTPCAELAPGSYVTLSVADTGTGISPGVLEHIFEPFYTTKDVGKGTGMGLATVYGVAKQCHGHITVESQPGRGTTFQVYLPLVKDWACANGDEQASEAPPALKPNITVLLVEDDALVRRMARRTLASEKCVVLEADTGEQAIATAELHGAAIDVLLTDVDLPALSGVETACRLAEANETLKVLFMSGHSSERVAGNGIPTDNWLFLPKPFTKLQLVDALRTLLKGTTTGTAVGLPQAAPR